MGTVFLGRYYNDPNPPGGGGGGGGTDSLSVDTDCGTSRPPFFGF